MKIPVHIMKTIKEIERLGHALSMEEQQLYSWLESKHIDAESVEMDPALETLFRAHDGEELIKILSQK